LTDNFCRFCRAAKLAAKKNPAWLLTFCRFAAFALISLKGKKDIYK